MSNKQHMLDVMIALCAEKFKGKFDRGGKPYMVHLMTVLHYVDSDDAELNCIAVGHDLVEDTDVTLEQLSQMGFSARVCAGIDYLTRHEDETYENYIEDLCTNRDAVLVKLADIRHNSDIRRLKGITAKDIARMEKYAKTYRKLQEIVKEQNAHS